MQRTDVIIELKLESFNELAAKAGLVTDAECADRIGIDRSQISRIRAGKTKPSEYFIGGCLRAFPEAKFEDLFDVTPAS